MPQWKKKDRRMYEHIKESAQERGASEDRAQELAGRTVNKKRRQEGRTPNKRTQGTGNPRAPLKERTVDELRNMAAKKNIPRRGSMRKSELIEALKSKR